MDNSQVIKGFLNDDNEAFVTVFMIRYITRFNINETIGRHETGLLCMRDNMITMIYQCSIIAHHD